jgi:N-acetylglucosamine-6-phosphate deacetylase
MSEYVIENGRIYTETETIERGYLVINNEKITQPSLSLFTLCIFIAVFIHILPNQVPILYSKVFNPKIDEIQSSEAMNE